MKLQDIITKNVILTKEELSKDSDLVKQIQLRLRDCGLLATASISGIYNTDTDVALKEFCEIKFSRSYTDAKFGAGFAKQLIEHKIFELPSLNALRALSPKTPSSTLQKFLPFLRNKMGTRLRTAHFLAQIAHESGDFNYVRELASGDAYEGRTDLGNTQPGDGRKFKGRGLIQITGRANYTELGNSLKVNLLDNPTLLETPELAVNSAVWFWNKNKLNTYADNDDAIRITRIINGGTNGLSDRLDKLTKIKGFYGLT